LTTTAEHDGAVLLACQVMRWRGAVAIETDFPRPDAVVVYSVNNVPKLYALECLPDRGTMEEKRVLYGKAGYAGTIFVFYRSSPIEISYPDELKDKVTGQPAPIIETVQNSGSLRDVLGRIVSMVAELERETGSVDEKVIAASIIEREKVTDGEARRMLGQLIKEGMLYSPKEGRLKRTSG